jgi:hypothetical protein
MPDKKNITANRNKAFFFIFYLLNFFAWGEEINFRGAPEKY